MRETREQTSAECREELAAHMVDMHFGLPEQGIDYGVLMGIDKTLKSFREEYGEALGLVSVAVHISMPDRALRAVAHVDGFTDDAKEVVGYVARIVEDHGLVVPMGLPEFTVSSAGLPRAS